MRLRQLNAELGGRLTLRWRAFPLRPNPDPAATFKGTFREEAWRRCAELAADVAITYRPWERRDYPTWSMPALEAAKCVALQDDPLFEVLHLKLYAAFFSGGVNIGLPEEVVGIVRTVPGLDVNRFLADFEAGKGRQAVLADYEAAAREHAVRAIPTVIFAGGRRIVGAVPLAEYRRLLAA